MKQKWSMNSEDLRLARLKRRMSQWALAQATGIGQSRISLFECGYVKLTAGELASISDVLGLAPLPDSTVVSRCHENEGAEQH